MITNPKTSATFVSWSRPCWASREETSGNKTDKEQIPKPEPRQQCYISADLLTIWFSFLFASSNLLVCLHLISCSFPLRIPASTYLLTLRCFLNLQSFCSLCQILLILRLGFCSCLFCFVLELRLLKAWDFYFLHMDLNWKAGLPEYFF